MTSYSSRLVGAMALMVAVAACGGNKGSAAGDSAMSSDLQMAGGAAATQPGLGDTAAAAKAPAPTTTPRAARPAPARPKAPEATKPAARPTGEIASGTSLLLHPSEKVCTNTHKVGDTLLATVADAVPGSNGLSIPSGATVKLEITALKRAENVKDPIDMGFNPVSVTFGGETYPISATVTAEKIDRVRNEPTSKDVQKVVGGAVIGAIAGKLIGKSTKGAVVGAATGAAAGGAVAATTANFEGCIAQGSEMTIKLNSPVTIH